MKTRMLLALILLCSLCYPLAIHAAEVKEITVMIGTPPADKPDILKEIIAKFEKAHPDIKIKYVAGADQKVITSIAGGVIPDVATINNNTAVGFYKSGGAVDLTPFIQADNFDLSQIPPNHESLVYQGRWYGMPQAGGAFADRAVFYNKDLYSAAGLAEPTYKWTWDVFATNVQKLTKDTNNDGVYEQVGYSFSQYEWPIYVWSGGGDIFNAARTQFLLNKEAAVNALSFWADLTSRGRVLYPLTAAQFSSQKAAMRTGSYNDAGNVIGVSFDWTMVEFPIGKAGSVNRRVSHPWIVPVGAKYPIEGWEWIKFWLSNEIQSDLIFKHEWRPPQTAWSAKLLARTKYDKPPYTYAPLMGINSTSKPLPIDVANWDQINNLITKALEPAWKGETSVLAAMNGISDQVMSLTK